MTNLSIALLIASLATGANTWGQNSTKDSRQLPTIEDRIGQLEQKQDDLSGQVDALNQKVTNLQNKIKFLEQKPGESSGNISQTPARPSGATAESSSDGTNGTQGASYDVFYDRLQGDGQWFNDETYGYVWQPTTASTDQKWRPYTEGRWVYTDRGWTWVSNEKFGWATYHYGRWARLSDRGWVWVPGDKWAPAWVSWRESDDYVGWAPLPPEADSDQEVKIEGWADNYYNIGPTAYVFLRTTDLGNQNYRDLIASPRDNLDFISRTKNVTNIYDGRDGVVDEGPIYDQLIQRSKVKIDKYQLKYVQQNSTQSQFGATVRGDQLQVLAPSPRLRRVATVEPKIAGNITDAQVERGWQNVDAASAQQLKQTWEKQTPVPQTLPQTPHLPKPVVAGARTREGEKSAGGNSELTQQPARSQATEATAPAPTPLQNEGTARSGQQPPVTNEDRRQEQNQGQRAETTPPAPTPNQKATQSGQQPIDGSENQRQGLNQEQRAETTRPASTPSPSPNRRAVQRSERESTSANQRKGSEDLEKTQATRKRSESVESENNQPAQSEEKPGRSGNVEQGSTNAARGADEKRSDKVPPKEDNATRQRTNKEPSPDEEGRRRDGEESPRKSNSNEPVRGLNEEKKGQGRGQSGDATPKKHLEEIEKKNVEPSVPQ